MSENATGVASPDRPAYDEPLTEGLSLRKLSVTFVGTKALDSASIDIRPGEVLGLIGQNGSGKSTAIKVIANYQQADPGERVYLDGEPARVQAGGVVSASGVRMEVRAVHQDLGLVEALGAVENVGLVTGYAKKWFGQINWRAQEAMTRQLLEQVDFPPEADLYAPLAGLSPLRRAQVAIARVLATITEEHCLLILDEPTASLAADQVQLLFDILGRLRSHYGKRLSILFVSHRIPEVFTIADRVTVLREGLVVATMPTAELDHDKLVQLMIGRADSVLATEGRPGRPEGEIPSAGPAEPDGAAHGVDITGLRSDLLKPLDLQLRPGEIVGVTGVRGSGAEEIPYLLVGAGPKATAGEMRVGDTKVPLPGITPRSGRRLGIALVPADRAREGLIMTLPIGANMTLPIIKSFSSGGWLQRRAEDDYVLRWARRLSLSHDDPMAAVRILSGGNAQKVVLSKALGYGSELLLLAEPTAGVDIGAKMLLYQHIKAVARKEKMCVIVQSGDELDLISLCDRVLVFGSGRVVADLRDSEIAEESILRATLSGVTSK